MKKVGLKLKSLEIHNLRKVSFHLERRDYKMDYDQILDEWADEIYKKIDKLREKMESEPFGTTTYLVCRGYIDGLAMSLAIQNRIEKKYKNKKGETR